MQDRMFLKMVITFLCVLGVSLSALLFLHGIKKDDTQSAAVILLEE